MAKQVMPEAVLDSRESDVELTAEQYGKIGLFAQLQRKPTLEKFPGALRLRRFHKGEIIFRQGEPGWTAFYILTSEDVLAIGQSQQESISTEPDRAAQESMAGTLQPKEIATLLSRLEQIAVPGAKPERLRAVATVYLAVPKPKEKKKSGWFGGQKAPSPTTTQTQQTLYIPVDGPVSISYGSMKDDLHEGEMFGEMSCLYRSPRSATIVAKRDCYMLEMLRNILDQIQKDPKYKAKSDEIYKDRVLRLHVRNLSIFRDLSDAQFEDLRKEVELLSVEPGQLICDEYDRSDAMYIVRSGLVKTMKNVSSLLTIEDVQNWPSFCDALAEGEQKPATPRGKLWQLLPADMRSAVKSASDPFKTLRDERRAILQCLNNQIKDPKFAEAKELKEVVDSAAVKDRAQELPANRKEWSDSDVRRYNRFILEAIYAPLISSRTRPIGPPMILSYRSRGEFIGEIGLMTRDLRSATCIAHGQPTEGGVVELVKISEQSFWKLINSSAAIKAKVEEEVAARKRASQERAKVPIWDDTKQVLLSQHFEELGLIQGQRLMLIDLERCTRCDECVRGCVNTHDDGRTRLFLDGPRFGKYLVPTSCRSCLDPVCMIGCPVGSIHRGDNKQIVIEDWCIGCGLCAEQCPYGSILMHDLGLVPEGARGWEYLPASSVLDEKWFLPKYQAKNWLPGRPPFLFGREVLSALTTHAGRRRTAFVDQTLCFRFEFDVPAQVLREHEQFKMEVTSADPGCQVWINGHELQTTEKPKRGKREFNIPPKADEKPAAAKDQGRAALDEAALGVSRPAAAATTKPRPADARYYLHAGRNVVAAKVTPLWMVRISNARTGAEELNLRGHESAIRCIAFAPDGKRVAAGGSDGSIRIWSLPDGKETANFKAHQGMTTALAFAPDGQRLLTGGEDRLAKLWTLDAKGAKEAAAFKGHEKLVTCVAFTPDGKRIATGAWDKTVRLWETPAPAAPEPAKAAPPKKGDAAAAPPAAEAPKPAPPPKPPEPPKTQANVPAAVLSQKGQVFSVAFAPDGKRLAVATDDGVVSLWDVDNASVLQRFPGHQGIVWSVSYAPDGRRIISGGNDGKVRVWDAAGTAGQLQCLESHKAAVRCVVFGPDARRAVSGSDDRTVRICDARAGTEVTAITGQQGKAYAVAFAPDGQRVAFSAQSFTTGDILLNLRLDKVNKPEAGEEAQEEVTEKLVTARAVVCDLCSTIPGQVPACVNACPHDAAMRVDARFDFPVR